MKTKIFLSIKYLLKHFCLWAGYFLLAYIILIPANILYDKCYKLYTGVTPGLGLYNFDGTVWVPFGNNLNKCKGLYLVPKEISDTKDCIKFQEWQGSNIPFHMHALCPWFTYTPYYAVQVNKTKFKIPRNMLARGEEDSMDSPTYMVRIKTLLYPDDKPTPDYIGLDPKTVRIKIIGGYKKDKLHDPGGYFQDPIDSAFWQFLLYMDPNIENHKFISYGYIKDDAHFRHRIIQYLNDGTPVETLYIYTNDKIENPKNFIVCSETSPGKRCFSIFPYKDVYVEFSFNRKYVSERNNIKNVIYKWLEEWEKTAQN